jgi:hypothetical protein
MRQLMCATTTRFLPPTHRHTTARLNMPPPRSNAAVKEAQQQPGVTPSAAAAGLLSTDVAAQIAAINHLLSLPPGLATPHSQAELAGLGVPRRLLELLGRAQDKSTQLLATRAVAAYLSTAHAGSAMQLALRCSSCAEVRDRFFAVIMRPSACPAPGATQQSPDACPCVRVSQALCGVLSAYQASHEAVTAGTADPAAAKAAAAARKLPAGVKEVVDPDDWLPVSCVDGGVTSTVGGVLRHAQACPASTCTRCDMHAPNRAPQNSCWRLRCAHSAPWPQRQLAMPATAPQLTPPRRPHGTHGSRRSPQHRSCRCCCTRRAECRCVL